MAEKPTLSDVLYALKISTGKNPFDAKYDVNGDGEITTSDVLGLQKAYVGKDPGFAFANDTFASPSNKTAADYAAEEKANQERIAAEQKETERRQTLLADAQKLNGLVNADLVANNPNLTAQQLSSLAQKNYWSNESEAFSRVMSGMESGKAQLKEVEVGADEWGNPIKQLALTTGEHPGFDTLYLRPTSKEGVYQFSTYNQKAGGNIHGIVQANPKTGEYKPIADYTKQIQYTPGQGGGFFGGIADAFGDAIGSFGDIYKSLGPIAPIIGNAIAPGLGSALSAAAALDEGNTSGAILSGLSAAGAYGGNAAQNALAAEVSGNADLASQYSSGLGGTLAENLPEIKTATSAAQLANAAQTGNVGGALTAAGNLAGVSGDPIISNAVKTIGLVQALDSGNTAQALTLAGQLTDNQDVKVAGDALKLVNAINTGNVGAIQSAATSLAKVTGADDVAAKIDQKTIDDVLDSVTKSDQTATVDDLAKIVSGADTVTGAEDATKVATTEDSVAGGEDKKATGEDTLVGGQDKTEERKDTTETKQDTLVGQGDDSLTHEDLIKIINGEDSTAGGKDVLVSDGGDSSGEQGKNTVGQDSLVGLGEDSLSHEDLIKIILGDQDSVAGGNDSLAGGESTKTDEKQDFVKDVGDDATIGLGDDSLTNQDLINIILGENKDSVDGGEESSVVGGSGEDSIAGGSEDGGEEKEDKKETDQDTVAGGEDTSQNETGSDTETKSETAETQTKSEEAKSDETKSDETKSDETEADETEADETETKSDETKFDEKEETKSDETEEKEETKDEESKTGTTLVSDDGSTITIHSDGTVTSTEATDDSGESDSSTTTSSPNIEYYDDGSYKVTYEDGTSAIFNPDGSPYSTVDDTDTNTISVFADDTSPSGFRDSLGNPVNEDGTPYVATDTSDTTITDNDTISGGGGGGGEGGGAGGGGGGASTSTGGSSTQTGGQSTQTGGQSTQTGGQSTQAGGQSTVQGGETNSNYLLGLLALLDAGGQQQQNTTPSPLADIKYYYDFGDPFNPKRSDKTKNEHFEFFDGGEINSFSVDDLIEILKKD